MAQFIAEWELAVRSEGGPLSAEQVGAYWKDSPATAYRRLAEFRVTFPELGDGGMPHDLMRPLLRRLEQGDQLIADVALEVPA